MRRCVFAGFMLFMALAPGASRAQEDAPWPPDPDAIFAEGVEVEWATPVADNDARLLYAFYNGGWSAYPFRNEFIQVNSNQSNPSLSRSDTVAWVFAEVSSANETVWQLWRLDLLSGEFSPYLARCGPINPDSHGYYPLLWAYYHHPNTGQAYLCNTETGELSPPLPDWSRVWPQGDDPVDHQPSLSPDGSYVIFFGYGAEECPANFGTALVAAYAIATKSLINLGEACGTDTAYVDRWINNTQAVVYTGDMPDDFWRGFRFVDVTRQGSLRTIVDGNADVELPAYLDNPPRFEKRVISSESGPCRVTIWDVTTQNSTEYSIGNTCDLLVRLSATEFMYRELDPNDGTEAALIRVNLISDEQVELIRGQFSEIPFSFPPHPLYGLGRREQSETGHPQFILYDLLTGDSIAVLETSDIANAGDFYHWWVNDNTLLYRFGPRPAKFHLARVTAEGVQHRLLDDSITSLEQWKFSKDGQHILYWQGEGLPETAGLLDVVSATSRNVNIGRASVANKYNIEINWNDQMNIYVLPATNETDTGGWPILFIIHIPEFES